MICETLVGLASQSPVVGAFVGAIISLLVELFPQWDNLPHDAKRWIVLALCLVAPLGALLLGVYSFACVGMVVTADALATAIAAGCQAFAASQITHLYVRNHK